jgi:hypothetical protein
MFDQQSILRFEMSSADSVRQLPAGVGYAAGQDGKAVKFIAPKGDFPHEQALFGCTGSGIARTYEFAADSVMPVGKVKKQFVSQISAVEGREIFSVPGQVLFCSQSLEGLLRDSEILGEVGVQSGDTIILL